MKVKRLLATLLISAALPAQAQTAFNRPEPVKCWYVPNGTAITLQCNNGFWQTTLEDGRVFTGNGTFDPNGSAQGSTIVINPATGGPYVGAGPTVTPPTQLPMLAPYQGQTYGYPLPE
jgi:hypothetical protein